MSAPYQGEDTSAADEQKLRGIDAYTLVDHVFDGNSGYHPAHRRFRRVARTFPIDADRPQEMGLAPFGETTVPPARRRSPTISFCLACRRCSWDRVEWCSGCLLLRSSSAAFRVMDLGNPLRALLWRSRVSACYIRQLIIGDRRL